MCGSLRKIRGWGLSAIFNEYLLYALPKARLEDQQLIESFEYINTSNRRGNSEGDGGGGGNSCINESNSNGSHASYTNDNNINTVDVISCYNENTHDEIVDTSNGIKADNDCRYNDIDDNAILRHDCCHGDDTTAVTDQ